MAKIALLSSGNVAFARTLVGNILSFPELAASMISLFDIDTKWLATSDVVARKIAAALGARPVIQAYHPDQLRGVFARIQSVDSGSHQVSGALVDRRSVIIVSVK